MKIRMSAAMKAVKMIEGVETVVIYDNHGNPVYVGRQIDNNVYMHSTPGSPDFEKVLKSLGIGLNTKYSVTQM